MPFQNQQSEGPAPIRSIDLLTAASVNNLLTLYSITPFAQYNWPNPIRPTYPVSLLTFLSSPTYLPLSARFTYPVRRMEQTTMGSGQRQEIARAEATTMGSAQRVDE